MKGAGPASGVELMSLLDELLEAGRKIAAHKLVQGGGGNLSGRNKRTIYITRSGAALADLSVDDLVAVDPSTGGTVDTSEPRPSSELAMHLAAYEARPDISVVLHVHPPKCIGLSLMGRALPALTPDFYLHLGPMVPLVPYITPTTSELAAAVGQKLDGASAVLLQNHGVIVVGESVGQALLRLLMLEEHAAIHLEALAVGEPRVLLPEEMRRLDEITAERYKHR